MDQQENKIDDSVPQYTPAIGEAQFTARAVIGGCLTGSIVGCSNIYIGLKIGWSFGASIIAAVLSYAIFALIGRKLSVLETNIAQTAGAAAGGMAGGAGLLNVVPAMAISGNPLDWVTLVLWAMTVAVLGVFYAVPLRRQYIEVDKLRFPSGTATAATIVAMNSESGDAIAKARALIWAGSLAGAFSLAAYFVPELEHPPLGWLDKWLDIGVIAAASAWGFKLYIGPSLIGAGLLMGSRVVLSILLGAILSWGVLGPLVSSWGWATASISGYDGTAKGWILWPGVALMVSEALTTLAMSWRTILRALQLRSIGEEDSAKDHERIPNSWWIGGLVVASLVTIVISRVVFDIVWYETLIAIALSAVLSAVAARSLGETDINPMGPVGKVTQLVFGGISPGETVTNLMSAGITSGGASQAGELLQDLKTGYLLGASARKQFVAQLIGMFAGLVVVIPVYLIFTSAYELGSDEIPAASAYAWVAMADLLTKGFSALPPYAGTALIVATAVGIVLPLLRRVELIKAFVPSGLAMGIAFLVPPDQSMAMFFGLAAWIVWKRLSPGSAERYLFVVASGIIAGDGLFGIVKAGLTLAGVKP
jgi:uncharacterized oligopeptide transporter (OPT) family protein